MALALEVLTRAVYLGPGLSCIGVGIDVNEVGDCHSVLVLLRIAVYTQVELGLG